MIFGTVPLFAQKKTLNIVFPKDKTEVTIPDAISGYIINEYVVTAKVYQKMSVKFSSKSRNFVYFNVLNDGDPVAPEAREAQDWSGTLMSDGTYIIEVYLVR